MKKLVLVAVAVVFLFAAVGTVMAAKPAGLGGVQTYAWHLSTDVMPVPPYGSGDIPGSDTASKLIVNQPNGNTQVTITGVMNGLDPNTAYTVYLASGYTPSVDTGWSVSGDYGVNVAYQGTNYAEKLVLTQSGTSITGVSLALLDGTSTFTINSGSVNGSIIVFSAYLNGDPTWKVGLEGTIAADGSMSGAWADQAPGTRTGTWATTSGAAVKTHTGGTGFPGLFTGTVQPFTFTTDAYGSASWHINLRDVDFSGSGAHTLSVWINVGATILISDNFNVVSN